MKIIAELLAEATEECVTCGGVGYYPAPTPYMANRQRWCIDCRGRGLMLSDDGRALVEFAAMWLAPHFAETDHGHGLH